MNEKDIREKIEKEIIPYQELKTDEFIDLSIDIIEDCRKYSPWLLFTKNSVTDLVDIFSYYLDFENPFILKDDDIESESEEEFSS